ncbi:MAG: alpha/beta hydrolase [Deltaproteobacteria bacterium]|nr:alpha/beta hydrolase [Deltaproteobacteria bacterium]
MTSYVTANGLKFGYLEQGTGPLVLLVHGFPDTAHTWDAVMPAIAAAGFRAVAPFTRGYHPTEIPADGKYDTDTLGADLVALIDALGEKTAVVVGHDWGASATYAAASIAPEKIRLAITLAIPHPASIIPTPRLAWIMRHFITLKGKRGAAKIRANDYALVDELFRRWSPAWKDVPAGETAKVKAAFGEPGVVEAALGYYQQLTIRMPRSLKKKISVPVVAFAGEHDNISPRAFEKARHWFTSSYEVVQVPGGHFMHREHPEHFVGELVRVLRDKATG